MSRGTVSPGKRIGYVYLIEDEQGRLKIGRSYDPKRRLAAVRTGSAGKVGIAHTWKITSQQSVALEGVLHTLFRPLRISGEWHDVGIEQVRPAMALLIAGDAEGATKLAAASCGYVLAERRHSETLRLRGLCSRRWHVEEYDQLTAKSVEERSELERLRRLAVSLGMEPNEWDEVLE